MDEEERLIQEYLTPADDPEDLEESFNKCVTHEIGRVVMDLRYFGRYSFTEGFLKEEIFAFEKHRG